MFNKIKQKFSFTPKARDPGEKRALAAFKLRHGMWVVFNGRTGIVTGFSDSLDSFVKVMLVDKLGLNDEEITAPGNQIRQAQYKEIPEARRPKLDHAIRLGYRN